MGVDQHLPSVDFYGNRRLQWESRSQTQTQSKMHPSTRVDGAEVRLVRP